jgi:hypothetical protein
LLRQLVLEQLTENLLRIEQAAREAYEAALLHKSDWGERPQTLAVAMPQLPSVQHLNIQIELSPA